MDEHSYSPGWPGRLFIAVVRGDPSQVFLADSDAVLSRLLAIELVAQSRPESFKSESLLKAIRTALLETRWGDAVAMWMEATGETVDTYPDEAVRTAMSLDSTGAALEISLAPIFDDSEPP